MRQTIGVCERLEDLDQLVCILGDVLTANCLWVIGSGLGFDLHPNFACIRSNHLHETEVYHRKARRNAFVERVHQASAQLIIDRIQHHLNEVCVVLAVKGVVLIDKRLGSGFNLLYRLEATPVFDNGNHVGGVLWVNGVHVRIVAAFCCSVNELSREDAQVAILGVLGGQGCSTIGLFGIAQWTKHCSIEWL